LGAPFDLAAAIAHVEAAIGAATIEVKPFPHMVIAEMLPPTVYRMTTESWPPAELLTYTNSMRRRQITVQTSVGRFPSGLQAFWRAIQDVGEAANRLLVQRFRPYLGCKLAPLLGADWLAELDRCTPGMRGAVLASYTGNIALAPHVDHVRILTNAFLYVSEGDATEPDLGTWLYRSLGLALPTNIQLAPKHLDMCLRPDTLVPYRANTCLAYVNGPTSFHGVAPVDIGARERRLLMFYSRLGVKDIARLLGEAFIA
jgi:hypothetical protein